MTIGAFERFSYYNTYYKPVNPTSDVLINKPERIYNISECAEVAGNNNSNIFVVSDWDHKTRDFSCAYQNPNISTAKFDNWASSLIKCEFSSCYEENEGRIGLNDNISLYRSSDYNLSYIEDHKETTTYTKKQFDNQVSKIETNLNNFLTALSQYLFYYYENVTVKGDTIQFPKPSASESHHRDYLNALNTTQRKLEKSLKDLNKMFVDTLEYTEKINSRCMQNFNLISAMNDRINTAERYFNLLMNENQGAIGELDINEYNRNQVIFENLVLIIILLIVIYLYFKNSN